MQSIFCCSRCFNEHLANASAFGGGEEKRDNENIICVVGTYFMTNIMCVLMVCWSQTILTLILYVRDSMSICIFHPMHNYYYAKRRRILYEKEKWIIMIWCEYGSGFAIPNGLFCMGIHLNLIRAHLFLDAFLLMLVLVVVVMVVLLLYSLRFVFFSLLYSSLSAQVYLHSTPNTWTLK